MCDAERRWKHFSVKEDLGVMLFRPPSHPAAMLKIIVLTKMCRRDGASTPGDRHIPRRWPPNFAPEVRVSGPTELYWFPDFYASASWSRDALSEKMGGLTRLLW